MIQFLLQPSPLLIVLAGQLLVLLAVVFAILILVRKLDEILALGIRHADANIETTKQELVETLAATRGEAVADLTRATRVIGAKVDALMDRPERP